LQIFRVTKMLDSLFQVLNLYSISLC
jgi:hypothetical protein